MYIHVFVCMFVCICMNACMYVCVCTCVSGRAMNMFMCVLPLHFFIHPSQYNLTLASFYNMYMNSLISTYCLHALITKQWIHVKCIACHRGLCDVMYHFCRVF